MLETIRMISGMEGVAIVHQQTFARPLRPGKGLDRLPQGACPVKWLSSHKHNLLQW